MADACGIRVLPEGTVIQGRTGEVLGEALIRAGIPLSLYCRQKGICGKCLVRIVNGPLPLLESEERILLEKRSVSQDHRLACRYVIRAPMTIEIPSGSRTDAISVLETGFSSPVRINPAVKQHTVDLPAPSLDSPQALVDDLKKAVKAPGAAVPLSVIRTLRRAPEGAPGNVTVTIYRDTEVLDAETDIAEDGAYGLAMDVGTSTVVVELVDLVSGGTVGKAAAPNSQISYGADVVSRIAFAFQNPDNLGRLRNSILQLLNGLIAEIVSESGVSRNRIYEAVVAGNTAMNHILCGVSVDNLALSPFHAAYSSLEPFPASELGLGLHPRAKAYIAPNIKSFVGGDITAGLIAAEMAEGPGNSLYIDLGTNGEIVLKKGRDFVATSTAAGPAFEGMSISCGMLAVPGAVYGAGWEGGFVLRTIGDLPAQGVCGTGLNDILALCLAHGLVAPDGKIKAPDRKIVLTESLSLSQQDVREIQLAVGAIKSGIRIILRDFNVSLKKLDRFYIAGAFGNSLDIANARILGLVPDVADDVVSFVGNASLAGARKLLLSEPHRAAAESLSGRIAHISLATKPGFQEEFIRALKFGI